MNRELELHRLIAQAQRNGFNFQHWFQAKVRAQWPGDPRAAELMAAEGRHFTLLFSHEFAQAYWRPGSQMRFAVPVARYKRFDAAGEMVEVARRPYTMRTIKREVWKYHLRQAAAVEDPLEYFLRFLPDPDDSD